MSEEEEGQAMIRGVLLLLNMTGVPRLTYRLMLDGRVPLRLKLILPAALVYLISRIDFIPDIVPVIGRIDDVVVILVSLAVFLAMAPRDVVLEHLQGGRDRGSDSKSEKPDRNVIDGSYRIVDEEGSDPKD